MIFYHYPLYLLLLKILLLLNIIILLKNNLMGFFKKINEFYIFIYIYMIIYNIYSYNLIIR